MNEIIEDFKKWQSENPDKEYQYDEIHDYVSGIPKGELLAIFDWFRDCYEEPEF